MENTSTEFSSFNFKRALDCLNTAYNFSTRSQEGYERLSNKEIWSDHSEFPKARILIGVEFVTNVQVEENMRRNPNAQPQGSNTGDVPHTIAAAKQRTGCGEAK